MPKVNKKREPYKYEQKPDFDFVVNHVAEAHPQKAKPFKAGKDRFFHQNYSHLSDNADGYSTVYQLIVEESDYTKIRKHLRKKDIEFELEKHIINFLEDCFIVRSDWDRFDKDMIMLSLRFPDVFFRVECFGEDFPGDLWIAYAVNGKYYQDDGEIVYPEFDYERLV